MAFVHSFHHYRFEITNPEKEVYSHARFKIPFFEDESESQILGRLIAYAHNFEPHDILRELDSHWLILNEEFSPHSPRYRGIIAPPDWKGLDTLLRSAEAPLPFYIYEQDHQHQLLTRIKSRKISQVQKLLLFSIEESPGVDKTALHASDQWEILILDNTEVHISVQTSPGYTITAIYHIRFHDIWSLYQHYLTERSNAQE